MKTIVADNVSAADLKKYGSTSLSRRSRSASGSAKASAASRRQGRRRLRSRERRVFPARDDHRSALADDFKKGADDYRKRDLFTFRAYDATRIELTAAGQTVRVRQDQRRETPRTKTSGTVMNVRVPSYGRRQEKMSVLLAAREPSRHVVRGRDHEDRPRRAGHDRLREVIDEGKKDERVTFGKSGSDVYAIVRASPRRQSESAEYDEINQEPMSRE